MASISIFYTQVDTQFHLCTSDRLALGQNGHRSLRHLLLVQDGRDLGAPAVRTHPDEMTCLVRLFSRVK